MEQIGLWSRNLLECVKNRRGWSSHLGWDRVCDQEMFGRKVFFPRDESFFFPSFVERYLPDIFPFEAWVSCHGDFPGIPLKLTARKCAGFISHQCVRFRSRQRTPNRALVDENCTCSHGKSKAWRLVVFYGFLSMGFITIKTTTIWENMFETHFFHPHQGQANPRELEPKQICSSQSTWADIAIRTRRLKEKAREALLFEQAAGWGRGQDLAHFHPCFWNEWDNGHIIYTKAGLMTELDIITWTQRPRVTPFVSEWLGPSNTLAFFLINLEGLPQEVQELQSWQRRHSSSSPQCSMPSEHYTRNDDLEAADQVGIRDSLCTYQW